jgi:hypothetical protein
MIHKKEPAEDFNIKDEPSAFESQSRLIESTPTDTKHS